MIEAQLSLPTVDNQKDIQSMTKGNNETKSITRRAVTSVELSVNTGVKKPLGIKIDPNTDHRLKVARYQAGLAGSNFNVSHHLEKQLVMMLEMLEKELGYNPDDFESNGRKVTKK